MELFQAYLGGLAFVEVCALLNAILVSQVSVDFKSGHLSLILVKENSDYSWLVLMKNIVIGTKCYRQTYLAKVFICKEVYVRYLYSPPVNGGPSPGKL